MDGRQGGHVSQCCGMGEAENAGQRMKCFRIRHWKKVWNRCLLCACGRFKCAEDEE